MLCEALGWRSVAEMKAGMSNLEYVEWKGYYEYKRAMAELYNRPKR